MRTLTVNTEPQGYVNELEITFYRVPYQTVKTLDTGAGVSEDIIFDTFIAKIVDKSDGTELDKETIDPMEVKVVITKFIEVFLPGDDVINLATGD